MHLVEDEFLRRHKPDQKRKMSNQEDRDSDHCASRHLRNRVCFMRLLWDYFTWQICVTANKKQLSRSIERILPQLSLS